jgi:dTDP-4-dehydrorhamnose reductase
MEKKIFMAGAGGMLGEAFYQQFKNEYTVKCTDKDLNADWLSFLDFRDFDAYRSEVIAFKPDWLFHLGAYTDLEFCEQNPEDTYLTNTKSVEHAVVIANELNIPLLYISTAGIFDGNKDVYDELDQPVPLGHYGKSKYYGEQYVQANANNYIICRAGWMMGGGEAKDKKFIQKLIKQLVSGKTVLNIVNDKLGTPTYTHDFAKNTKLLVEKGQFGLFNMVCGGMTGRVEVARELVRLLNMDDTVNIEEVPTEFFAKEYFAERPACERLINKRLNDLGLNIMRDWKPALADYIQSYYSDKIKK